MILKGTFWKREVPTANLNGWNHMVWGSLSLKLLWLQCRRCSGNCVFSFSGVVFSTAPFRATWRLFIRPARVLTSDMSFDFFATLCDWFFSWARRKCLNLSNQDCWTLKNWFALLMQALWILFYHVCYNIWSLFCWSDSLRSWDVACSVGLWTSPPSDGRRGLRCSSAKSSPSHWQQLAKCSGGSRSDSISEAGGLLIPWYFPCEGCLSSECSDRISLPLVLFISV